MQTAFLGLFLFGFLTVGSISFAADPARLAFSSFSATTAGFFTAIDEKIFDRGGIDLTYVHIASSSMVMPAVLTSEVDLPILSGEIGVRAYHQGAKNLANVVHRSISSHFRSIRSRKLGHSESDKAMKLIGAENHFV